MECPIDNHKFGIDTKNIKDRPNNRISSAYYALCVDFFVGLLLGNPLVFSTEEEENEETIQEFIIRVHFQKFLQGVMKRMGAQGAVGVLLYVPDASGVRLMVVPREDYIIIRDSADQNVTMLIRYYQSVDVETMEKHMYAEVYTPDFLTIYREDMEGLHVTSKKPNLFTPEIPFVEFRNTEDGETDFDPAKDYIDAYDVSISIAQNVIEMMNRYIMFFSGALIQEKDIAKIMKKGYINFREPDGKVGVAAPPSADTYYEMHKRALREGIHTFGRIPDVTSERFANAKSGISKEWQLLPTLQKAAEKWTGFSASILDVFRVWSAYIKNYGGKTIDWKKISVKYTEKLPRDIANDAEIAETLGDLVDKNQISLETVLSLLSFISDPKREIQKIKEESKWRNTK